MPNDVQIVLVGLSKNQLKKISSKIIGIEKTENVDQLVALYSIADVLVNPNFIDGDQDYINNFIKNIIYLDGFKLPMTWNQLSILKEEGHIIGAHTMDHLRLNISKSDVPEFQIKKCKQSIENHVGGECNYFVYPYGKLTDISNGAINIAVDTFKYNFTQTNHKKYFSFNERFINRIHFEGIDH